MPIFADFITFSTVIYPLNKSNDILPHCESINENGIGLPRQ